MIERKTADEIDLMREAGAIVAEAIELIRKEVKPGVATKYLDNVAEEYIRQKHATPAFKGYQGFPASLCISINEAVVHGIPDERRLEEGQIVSIDIGVKHKGFYGDAAFTVPVGEVSDEAKRLIETTRQALAAGIEKCRAGRRLFDISHAIQELSEAAGFSVVRDYVGHGIGRAMHEDPQIPNFGPPDRGPVLEAGMVFALEPMVNAGGYEVEVLDDKWTVVTADRSLSAHFEHTVAITPSGPLILTSL